MRTSGAVLTMRSALTRGRACLRRGASPGREVGPRPRTSAAGPARGARGARGARSRGPVYVRARTSPWASGPASGRTTAARAGRAARTRRTSRTGRTTATRAGRATRAVARTSPWASGPASGRTTATRARRTSRAVARTSPWASGTASGRTTTARAGRRTSRTGRTTATRAGRATRTVARTSPWASSTSGAAVTPTARCLSHDQPSRNRQKNEGRSANRTTLVINCVRRRPTLPRSGPRSTIGAERLSFRVRDGTGRFPLAMVAETLWRYGPHRPPHPNGQGRRGPYLRNRTVDA